MSRPPHLRPPHLRPIHSQLSVFLTEKFIAQYIMI
jgi:hypothetical protein